MASAIEDTHDHSVLTDLLGVLLGVTIGVLLISATFAGAAMLFLRWMSALSS